MKRFLGALLSLMIMLACLGVQAEEISPLQPVPEQ